MTVGQVVRVPLYGGEVAQRIIVQIIDNMALVSTISEYNDAARENRNPVAMGIPLEAIIPVIE
jgi:hypothetical protein